MFEKAQEKLQNGNSYIDEELQYTINNDGLMARIPDSVVNNYNVSKNSAKSDTYLSELREPRLISQRVESHEKTFLDQAAVAGIIDLKQTEDASLPQSIKVKDKYQPSPIIDEFEDSTQISHVTDTSDIPSVRGAPTPPVRALTPPIATPTPRIRAPTPPMGAPTPPIGAPTPPIATGAAKLTSTSPVIGKDDIGNRDRMSSIRYNEAVSIPESVGVRPADSAPAGMGRAASLLMNLTSPRPGRMSSSPSPDSSDSNVGRGRGYIPKPVIYSDSDSTVITQDSDSVRQPMIKGAPIGRGYTLSTDSDSTLKSDDSRVPQKLASPSGSDKGKLFNSVSTIGDYSRPFGRLLLLT